MIRMRFMCSSFGYLWQVTVKIQSDVEKSDWMYIEEAGLIMMECSLETPIDLKEFEDLKIWIFVCDTQSVVHKSFEFLHDIVNNWDISSLKSSIEWSVINYFVLVLPSKVHKIRSVPMRNHPKQISQNHLTSIQSYFFCLLWLIQWLFCQCLLHHLNRNVNYQQMINPIFLTYHEYLFFWKKMKIVSENKRWFHQLTTRFDWIKFFKRIFDINPLIGPFWIDYLSDLTLHM